METAVLLLTILGVLTVTGTVPPAQHIQTKHVDADFVQRQQKVLYLLESIGQYRKDADWWKIGYEYDVEAEANIDKYTSLMAVEEFLIYYKSGFMPKHKTFSDFHDRMRKEAIAIFKIFFYAKDFETFYKTAAFARVHFNDGQFLYAFYSAIYQRHDTYDLVLPAPYEMFPQYFVNTETFLKAYRMKMQSGDLDPDYAAQHGMFYENGNYVVYSNYSSPWVTGNEEDKLSYFTEDIGMNSFYYLMKAIYPFWWNESFYDNLKMRSEIFYFVYQQLIAQYYQNRLSNGMGEIPKFSWSKPIKTGYTCALSTYYPFIQRNNWYQIDNVKNEEYLQFLDHYEENFLYYLEQGHFKAYGQNIDLRDSRAIEFVGNYWFTNVDLYKKSPTKYERFYEIIGLHVLAGTPDPVDKYTVLPSALELYQTSLRDPVFYQFYARILNYIVLWKKQLDPYSYSQLHFEGVKIIDVQVDKLVTYFEFFDFDITKDIFHSAEESKSKSEHSFKVRQPRLNHKPFTVTIDIKSDVTANAVVKLFLGPKYDSNGYSLSIEDNWMNFIALDWFVQKLSPGQNKIKRNSKDFAYFREDSVTVTDIFKMLEHGEIPLDMSENFFYRPNRMMLPKGVKGGFPLQIFIVVYPHTSLPKGIEYFYKYVPDTKPLTYPFDRPVIESHFNQPNIDYKDVFIYHEGEEHPNLYNVHKYFKDIES